ncbi:MAG TPA: tripartite tricarboxylate transporter substrate-binding protein [Xanthobacteraceae bacterium]|nr:tripartite tricarboxylate transporter substrate-binding protein [Xanthobacteraceae bacterium]
MRWWLIALGAALWLRPAAHADPIADFYKGRSISWILSAGAGGGYSSYAQAFAPYFSAHIPGNPTIVVQNMPGGGGIRAMLYLESVAPKDGATLGLVHSSVPFAPLYGIRAASFDPRKMNWIGSIDASTGICVAWHTSGIATWQDLLTKTFVVGGSGAGSQMETMPEMLNKLFGTKIKVVSGYKGGNDIYLAMERGEIQGRCGGLISSISATRPDWFPQKKVSVPIQIATARNPMFPDVPTVMELAKDERTKKILQLVLAPLEMDRPILAPPGAPPERVAALREAFHAAMNDPGFIAEAAKEHLEIREISGPQVARVLDDAYAMPPEITKAATEAMNLTGAGGD